jgi:RNA polymerase sigma-70 factor (ECF subfamily)
VDEIASALLSNKETIKKRLQRAKQFISDNNLKFDIPVGAELNNRLDIVLQAIYLLFNEGYNSNSKDLIRKDLCEEALRLALMLTEHTYTNKPKCAALVSLFALQVSRFDARESELGEIILLENQDRDKWNQQLIKIGLDYLRKSSEGSELSEYHIEAAIAAQHASAKSFLETNWENILNLYDLLIQVNHSPVVLLNRAIVLSKVRSVKDSIKEIENIPGVDKLLQSNYLFCSVLGELYRLDNKSEKANQFFLKAISLTNSESEKKLLQRKISMIKD